MLDSVNFDSVNCRRDFTLGMSTRMYYCHLTYNLYNIQHYDIQSDRDSM